MSIASEISRLQGAKADIKTAIEGKGVTVPSATKLDGYANLVDAIPQGSTPTGTKQISVTQNGTRTENVSGYASAQLNVAVPNSYSAGDEGKVVSNGALVAQTSDTVTTNDTYDTTLINSLTVNVSGGGGWSTEDFLAGLAPSGAIVANDMIQIGPIFYNNKGITSFLSDTITKILTGNAFFGCTALQTVKMTATITQLQDGNHWQGCTSLTSLELPNMTANFSSYGARGCTSLTLIDAGKTGQINANAFNGCSVLNKLIIRRTSVAPLQNVSAFTGTPFASGGTGGTIYVPSSLISSYQSASNWSTIHGYGTITWKAIEGSQYE